MTQGNLCMDCDQWTVEGESDDRLRANIDGYTLRDECWRC